MSEASFFLAVRNLIARNDLPAALNILRDLLQSTPHLNEILQQSGRLEYIQQKMRIGSVSHADASLEQNQIRMGVLELLNDIEQQGTPPTALQELLATIEKESARPNLRNEVEHAISIVNSKNVLINSTITAGRDVLIGDQNIQTESRTSRGLRLFLFLFVPLLVFTLAYLWYRSQPVTLTATIQYQAPNPELAFEKGTITLHQGGKTEIKSIENEIIFPNIQRGETVSVHFVADGFVPMDTTFIPEKNQNIILSIQHDDSRAFLSGFIYDERTGRPIEGVKISIPCCNTRTDAFGKFEFNIPPLFQRREQSLKIDKEGYETKNMPSSIQKGEPAKINLRKLH